jgi:glycine/D-amino acid oxidase-like deaminating enzyme
MKPRIVIVGAGLGGCFVAHGLAETHDVTMVELGSTDLQARVNDLGAPANMAPHIGAGLGGTTALWHNGLIEVDEQVFREVWPFAKEELAPYYAEVYPLLAGVRSEVVERGITTLRQKYAGLGLPKLLLPGLFYPRARRNAWNALKLEGRVRVVTGEAVALEPERDDRIRHVRVKTARGEENVDGDAFVLAAGGLSTPVLLQQLATRLPLPSLEHAGRHYEDHPMNFVGELTMRAPLYRFWNFDVPGAGGNVRMPLVVRQDGLHVSFQIRPAANFYRAGRRERVHSVVTEIRNNRFNPLGYLRLLTHADDVLDILSFEFGIRVPTTRYSLIMYAQQPPSTERAVWAASDPATGRSVIQRNWQLSPGYLEVLDRAVAQLLGHLGDTVSGINIFPNWRASLQSAAHHSGTARMAASPDDGVCDANAGVHGLQNLYVADGSIIPGSGIANTGLTIAALAARLARHLRSTVPAAKEVPSDRAHA